MLAKTSLARQSMFEVMAGGAKPSVGFRGLDGEHGKDGRDGAPGRAPTPQEIAAAVAAYLRANPPRSGRDAIQYPAPRDGENGRDGNHGKDGRGVEDVELETDGENMTVRFHFTDKSKIEKTLPLPIAKAQPVFARGGQTIMRVRGVAQPTAFVVSKTADYAMAAGIAEVVLCNGTFTVTLPTASNDTYRRTVKNTGSGTITVATTGGQTIDGASTVTLAIQNESLDFVSDGANWNIL